MIQQSFVLERKNRQTGNVWIARCHQVDHRFVVIAGCIISDKELKRLPKKIKSIRDTAPIDDDRVLLRDMVFDTLSDAASFVLATNAWGEREWKEVIL